jgi:hypothetical protein
MPIASQADLDNYLIHTLRTVPDAARLITADVVFEGGRFRGAGPEFISFLDGLTGREVRLLLIELNNPRILYDHYPGANGTCVARDNWCCAQY